MAHDVKTIAVKVPVSYMATSTLAATDYVVDLTKHKNPADLAAFLIDYGYRVIIQRATAGIKNGDTDGARDACKTRRDNLYDEDCGAGGRGPRIDPVFRDARDFVAKQLKIDKTEIVDWEWITGKLGAPKTAIVRDWATKRQAMPNVEI